MQTVAAYLLERTGLDADERANRVSEVSSSIDRWLGEKGVSDVAAKEGTFSSLSPNGGGTFARDTVVVGSDSVQEVVLRERANPRQVYITRLVLSGSADSVRVYATVSVANTTYTIEPLRTPAKCPFVIKDIIRTHGDWTLGESPIPSGKPGYFKGRQGGSDICRIVTSHNRSFPLVLVSTYEGQPVWEAIERKIASDLTGLSYVSMLDEEAGWEISDRLDRRYSCYDGAIRIYWPNVAGTGGEGSVQTTVWTPDRLLDVPDGVDSEDRFREELRRRVMSVAAVAISEPPEIWNTYRAFSRQKLAGLEGKSAEAEEVFRMAEQFADAATAAEKACEALRAELDIARVRAENAEAQLAYRDESDRIEDSQVDLSEVSRPELDEINEGDVLFYKKKYSTPNHDIMVRRGDCGHNAWESANKAPKAWKGVERLEKRRDWKSFQH